MHDLHFEKPVKRIIGYIVLGLLERTEDIHASTEDWRKEVNSLPCCSPSMCDSTDCDLADWLCDFIVWTHLCDPIGRSQGLQPHFVPHCMTSLCDPLGDPRDCHLIVWPHCVWCCARMWQTAVHEKHQHHIIISWPVSNASLWEVRHTNDITTMIASQLYALCAMTLAEWHQLKMLPPFML